MKWSPAEVALKDFIDALSEKAVDGVLGEKPIAIVAALKYVCSGGIIGKPLLEIFSSHGWKIRPYFLELAKTYSNLSNPSSSWSVITGTKRELQKAIEQDPQVDAAFSQLTIDDMRALLGEYTATLGTAKQHSTRDFSNELSKETIEEWSHHIRVFKPLSGEAMKAYVEEHQEHYRVFTEILDFLDKKIEDLVQEGNPKRKAELVAVRSIRKAQQQSGFQPNLNLAKISGIKQYIKTYDRIHTGMATFDRPPKEVPIKPESPFTALMNIFDLFANLNGPIMLFDKHFDEKGLKFLRRLQPSKVDTVRILTGRAHLSQDFKEVYGSFRKEMANEGISVELRVLNSDDEGCTHDRFLISRDFAYLTPPWNIVHEKLGEIVRIDNVPRRDLERFWSRASKIS